MKSKLYDQGGKEIGNIALPDAVFGVSWNEDLVHQVMVSMMSNARHAVAHTKGRGEVRGGGKKPWRQKGTGRARHGSRRSPLWRTGGVTFGPTNERNFEKKINKKMKTKALYAVLSRKLKDNEILFVDRCGMPNIKTKNAKEILNTLSAVPGFDMLASKKRNAAFILLPKKDEIVHKSFGNFSNIEVDEFQNINVLNLLKYKYIIIVGPEESIKIITGSNRAEVMRETKTTESSK